MTQKQLGPGPTGDTEVATKDYVDGEIAALDSDSITDATAIGKALLTAADALEARTAIGAGFAHAVSVKDFGAVGDGVADDRQAFQDAVDALAASESLTRRLIVPWTEHGYRIDGSIIVRGCHGLTIEGDNTLITGASAGKSPIHVRVVDDEAPEYGDVYDISYVPARHLAGRYRPGDTTITMTGSGESSSEIPVAGDWIYIRTGDVVPGDAIATPIAEINYAIDVTDDVITLAYPLKHPYCNFGDGTVFGVAVVNDIITTDLTLRGLHLHHDAGRAANLWSVVRLKIDDCHFSGSGALHARGRFMDLDYTADITPNWSAGYRPYALALDTGTCDVTAKVKAVSSGMAIVHIHEGVSSARLDINIQCGKTDPGTEESWAVVSLLAVIRDVKVSGTITNSPLGPAVTSAPSSVYPSWGNENCSVDVTVEGSVAGEVLRHSSNFTSTGASQDVLVVPSLKSGYSLPTTVGPSTGAIGTSKFSQPVTLTAISGEAATQTTESGEVVFSLADGVTQGVQCLQDVPSGGWTHAMLCVEAENVEASGNVTLHNYARTGVAGRTPSFSGVQDQSLVMDFGGAGRTVFIRTLLSLGGASRVGFRIRRNGGGGADTLAGAVKLRRAWIVYYVSPNAALDTRASAAIEATGPTLSLSDNNSVYTITGPTTQTVTVPAASSLVEGWRCWIHADVDVNVNAPIIIAATGGVSASLAPGDLALAYVANGVVVVKKFRAPGSHSGTTANPSQRTTNVDIFDYYSITEMGQSVTMNAPIGTPTAGQHLTYAFKDDGTSRAIAWNPIFRSIATALPTSTTISKWLYVQFIYNAIDTKWDAIDVKLQA